MQKLAAKDSMIHICAIKEKMGPFVAVVVLSCHVHTARTNRATLQALPQIVSP